MLLFGNKRRNLSMLEEFVYLIEKGTPVKEEFLKFSDDRLGKLLTRVVKAYNRNRYYKDSISVEHEKVVMGAQQNILRKKQLTQNISHELKTPVSSINGYLETLIANEDMDREKMLHFVNKAYQQSCRLTDLLSDLSTITRMEEASEQIEKEECDVSALISDVISDITATSIPQQIRCDYPQGMKIIGNAALLQSIFHNLLKNAVQYSNATVISVSLISEEKEFYEFSVKDNGIGVEAKHLPLLFERFYRVDKGRSRKLGGTGLGLSIVKNAVSLHNGTIRAELVGTGGLEFIFTLSKA